MKITRIICIDSLLCQISARDCTEYRTDFLYNCPEVLYEVLNGLRQDMYFIFAPHLRDRTLQISFRKCTQTISASHNRSGNGMAEYYRNQHNNDTKHDCDQNLPVISGIGIAHKLIFIQCHRNAPAICSWNRRISLNITRFIFFISIECDAALSGYHLLFNLGKRL